MTTATIETVEVDGKNVPDLTKYVRKIDLLMTARRLRKENNWCSSPLSAVKEMGVDERALIRPNLSDLPIGSVITQPDSYSVYVWVKRTEEDWERTHSGAFNDQGEITDTGYVRTTFQGRNLPTRYNVIFRPDGKYEMEVPDAETDPSKIDLKDYVLKSEVLRITLRYVSSEPETYDIVMTALAALGVDVPERVKAADLLVGSLISARSYDHGNFSALKVADNEWSATSWDAVNRGGFLSNGSFIRKAMTDAQLDNIKFAVLHNPNGVYQD